MRLEFVVRDMYGVCDFGIKLLLIAMRVCEIRMGSSRIEWDLRGSVRLKWA